MNHASNSSVPLASVLDARGSLVRLGQELARGGEGTIYQLAASQSSVAKIYHRAPEPERANKIRGMVASSDATLAQVAAWPSSVLVTPPHTLVGFVMPAVIGYHELHLLHSPQSRRIHFPDAGWNFLVHVSTNIARAFEVVHAHGHVVGDVNDRNIMVHQNGTVKFVDCDSFQIRTSSELFPCGIGAATHTPPELQSKSLRGEVRTINHDNFGLAVLIFQLLFMGRHPFAGVYSGPGDMPIEKAILQNRFAFSRSASTMLMARPPGTLKLESVTSEVAQLFERAFSEDGMRLRNRPSPGEWRTALHGMARSLSVCSANSSHFYYSALATCPWCQLQKESNVTFFGLSYRSKTGSTRIGNVDDLWKRIDFIQPPPQVPNVKPMLTVPPQPPSTQALAMAASRRRAAFFAIAVFLVAVGTVLFLNPSTSSRNLILIGAVAAGGGIYHLMTAERRKYRAKLQSEQMVLQGSISLLDVRLRKAGPDEFEVIKRRLQALKDEHASLPQHRADKLKQLNETARQRQLSAYLNRYKIANASITGVGATRVHSLRLAGIECAEDVTKDRVQAVPGFGHFLTRAVVAWRTDLERRFYFDPAKAVTPQDVARVDSDIAKRDAEIRSALANGLRQLEAECLRAQSEVSAVLRDAQPLLESLQLVHANLSKS